MGAIANPERCKPGVNRPCAHCERELAPEDFRSAEVEYCRECESELRRILARKYSKLESALQRAQERRRQRQAGF